MKKQIEEAIEAFGEDLSGLVTSPCARHLLETRDEAKQLDKERKEIFHTVTAKLLYIEKRARPDIETAIGFLTTRVDKSDEDDWKKLRRVVQYLKQTIDDLLELLHTLQEANPKAAIYACEVCTVSIVRQNVL